MIFVPAGIAPKLAERIVQYGGLFTNPEHSFVTSRSPLRGDPEPARAEDVLAAKAITKVTSPTTLSANDRCCLICCLLSTQGSTSLQRGRRAKRHEALATGCSEGDSPYSTRSGRSCAE